MHKVVTAFQVTVAVVSVAMTVLVALHTILTNVQTIGEAVGSLTHRQTTDS